ncbi:hypothetical protein, partial [Halorussus sp. GCM10023401]
LSLAAAGGAAIALRGYLVPYTPRFAPRLVSRLPGDPFHADGDASKQSGSLGSSVASGTSGATEATDATCDTPETSDATDSDARDEPDASGTLGDAEAGGERVVGALAETGVVVAEGEALFLDEAFRDAWEAEMRDLRERDDGALEAALREAAPAGAVVETVEPRGERWFVVSDGSDDPANESWLTRPVAVAETAAVRALDDRTDLDPTLRARASAPLRMFLEVCPDCGGPVEETTTVECCGGTRGTLNDPVDEVLACVDCEARLYTF